MGLENINEIRKYRGFTIEQLSTASGIPVSTIKKISAGITSNPSLDTVRALAKALGCTLDDFDSPVWGKKKKASIVISELTTAGHRIGRAYEKAPQREQGIVEHVLEPYVDKDSELDNIIRVDFGQSELRSSAGKGIHLDDESMITIKVRLDALPADYQRSPGRYFGVPVGGNSMEPRFYDNDILIVSKEPVNVGEIGIFTMEGEGYVKELGRGVLHSLNPEYEDIPLTEDIRCNGKVVGVLDPTAICKE